MGAAANRLPQDIARAARPALGQVGVDIDAQSDALLQRALEGEAEQSAHLEATGPVEVQYSAALMAQVEAKHGQVARIEDRLESLIEQQSSRLQQSRAKQPGVLSMPGTRTKWQQQLQQQQCSLQRLQARLETVREIKDGMGIHGPRIEEMAARKVRSQEPKLASDWADMREAQRRHEAMLRQQEVEKKRVQGQEEAAAIARGLRLGLAHVR